MDSSTGPFLENTRVSTNETIILSAGNVIIPAIILEEVVRMFDYWNNTYKSLVISENLRLFFISLPLGLTSIDREKVIEYIGKKTFSGQIFSNTEIPGWSKDDYRAHFEDISRKEDDLLRRWIGELQYSLEPLMKKSLFEKLRHAISERTAELF